MSANAWCAVAMGRLLSTRRRVTLRVKPRGLLSLGIPLCVAGCAIHGSEVAGFDSRVSVHLDALIQRGSGVVVFDADGTLWSNDVGVDFFDWEVHTSRLLAGPLLEARRLRQAFDNGEIGDREMWSALATSQVGLEEAVVADWAATFFRREYRTRVFAPMRALVAALQRAGVEVWICSASQRWIVEAGARDMGVPTDRVVAVAARVADGRITDQLIEPMPYKAGKVAAIRQVIGRTPDLVFGNSEGDAEMLAFARIAAIVINPSESFAAYCEEQGWLIQRFPVSN